MAVSNNDRVSSQRLLDTLKGLQESRHLGSEPEVSTETVVIPAVQSPAVGTYASEEEFIAVLATPDERQMPFYVYTEPVVGDISVTPITVNEPTGDVVELAMKTTYEGVTMYVQESFEEITTYQGYAIFNYNGIWLGKYINNGGIDNAVYYWYAEEKTITTTVTTRRPVAQKYLPNADWNVNDPDADGYVEGRTHWVEIGETEATASIVSVGEVGNFAIGACDSFGPVKGFAYPNGEYKPGRIGEVVDVAVEGQTMQFSYIGEDANGNAIIPTNYTELESALSTTNIGVLLLMTGNMNLAYIAYPNTAVNDVCAVTIVSENVHKLDRKFYEYTPPIDASNFITPDTVDFSRRNIMNPRSSGTDNPAIPNFLGKHVGGSIDTTTDMSVAIKLRCPLTQGHMGIAIDFNNATCNSNTESAKMFLQILSEMCKSNSWSLYDYIVNSNHIVLQVVGYALEGELNEGAYVGYVHRSLGIVNARVGTGSREFEIRTQYIGSDFGSETNVIKVDGGTMNIDSNSYIEFTLKQMPLLPTVTNLEILDEYIIKRVFRNNSGSGRAEFHMCQPKAVTYNNTTFTLWSVEYIKLLIHSVTLVYESTANGLDYYKCINDISLSLPRETPSLSGLDREYYGFFEYLDSWTNLNPDWQKTYVKITWTDNEVTIEGWRSATENPRNEITVLNKACDLVP